MYRVVVSPPLLVRVRLRLRLKVRVRVMVRYLLPLLINTATTHLLWSSRIATRRERPDG